MLLVSSRHYLNLYELVGTTTRLKRRLLRNLTNAVAIDYLLEKNMVFWTDVSNSYSEIGTVGLNEENNSYKVFLL